MKYEKDTINYDINECAICMEEFQMDENLLRVPQCKHIFHPECVMKWLEKTKAEVEHKCPLCN